MSVQTIRGREPQDLTYINVQEELEVHWWAARFSVTPEQLRAAVQEHGTDAQQIEQKLKAAGKASLKNMGED